MVCEVLKMVSDVFFDSHGDCVCLKQRLFSQSQLWASARVPAGSVPTTQSQKREVWTIMLWHHARAC